MNNENDPNVQDMGKDDSHPQLFHDDVSHIFRKLFAAFGCGGYCLFCIAVLIVVHTT